MAGSLGEFEQLLLLGLMRRSGEASGIELRQELSERAGRDLLPGAVYTIMERLRIRDYVSSYTGETTSTRGGRRRKYYRMTARGERALAESYQQVARMAEGLAEALHTRLEQK